MSQFAFEASLSQSGMCIRSRYDGGLVGETTGRMRDDGDELMAQIRLAGTSRIRVS